MIVRNIAIQACRAIAFLGCGAFMLQGIAFLVDHYIVNLGLALSRIVLAGLIGMPLGIIALGVAVLLETSAMKKQQRLFFGAAAIAFGLLCIALFTLVLSL